MSGSLADEAQEHLGHSQPYDASHDSSQSKMDGDEFTVGFDKSPIKKEYSKVFGAKDISPNTTCFTTYFATLSEYTKIKELSVFALN